MKKCVAKKKPTVLVKRHIEDAPFYRFTYGLDDLPLDPAKSFLKERIDRLRKANYTEEDFELDVNEQFKLFEKNDETLEARDIHLSEGFQILENKPQFLYAFEQDSHLLYPWLRMATEKPSEDILFAVTSGILEIYRDRRVQIFLHPARTRAALFTNKLQRLYGGPSDTIGSFRSWPAKDIRLTTVRKRKKSPEFKVGDHWAIRTPEELRIELERVGKAIDKLIEPDLKRAQMRAEGNLKEEEDAVKEKTKRKCNVCKVNEIFPTTTLKKKFDPAKYMEKLTMKEKEKFKYLEGFLPVDPEQQKQDIFRRHYKEWLEAMRKFTSPMRERTISLMKNISITMLESYPSHLIRKVLPRIDTKLTYLKDAYRFMLLEQKLWPHVFPEVILMDYLFNPEHHISEKQAILIVSSLIDLQEDFRYFVKRSFLRYILMSPLERTRLQLEVEPPEYPLLTIRAPVPWKIRIQIATNRLDQVLMINHPVIQALSSLWHQLYHNIIIFNTNKLLNRPTPLDADQITKLINNSCLAARDILVNDWLPRCADLLDAMRNSWKDLIPMRSSYGGRAEILFNCIHSLMSHQLQGLIKRSIKHLYDTLEKYKGGNDIENYDVNHPKLLRRPLMTLITSIVGRHFGIGEKNEETSKSIIYKVDKTDPVLLSPGFVDPKEIKHYFSTDFIIEHSGKLFVYPYMDELPDLFVSYFIDLLKVGYDIPRLEYVMTQHPDQLGYLHYIHENHVDMKILYEKVRKIVRSNWNGPKVYLYPIYEYYNPLLNGRMLKLTESIFSQEDIPGLQTFQDLMKKLKALAEDIYYLRDFIPLNLFMLDNRHANRTLATLVRDIMEFIADYFKILNQNENRRLCDELEEMSMKAGERPEEIAEVVALQNYLNDCRDEKIHKIKDIIKNDVSRRVIFLLHYGTLDSDDIHLNSRTFLLPSELEQVLDLSAARLSVVRDNLEVQLRKRRSVFELYLEQEGKRMENFRMRECREILTLDELKEKVEAVAELFSIIQKASREAKTINIEEQLLQIDQSFFPVLSEIIEKMEPIERLWKTAYEFERSHEIWMYGPFVELNADAIREAVENMYKTIYKLTRQLSNVPSSKRVAEQIRVKIDKFRLKLPILDAICRQGMQDRHWQLVSEKLNRPCNPTLYPSLKSMIDIDIRSILSQLEDISNAAFKEHELLLNLIAMQKEWEGVEFELIRYRDTDVFILASIDDIQTILDDQVLKVQAMKRSPFIAALGEKADDWENKLITMQDILDSWIQVQSTWMYLEPIFGSEDILRQMPVEGRNFKTVDSKFRRIMKYTQGNPGVIASTDYPNLLQMLKGSIEELESVTKGLNSYLEQKRLFFARFFFLSNDELLEILSETKDPTRVQPHLKKCFEGIYFLTFTKDQEITHMISEQTESVKLVRRVNPSLANGLVELWLKEVEGTMLDSVLEQMKLAHDDYPKSRRDKWVLTWPGQVVQTQACLIWTSEAEEAILENTIDENLKNCNVQIRELVNLVRGKLSSGERTTIEALIVLDVHARDVIAYLLRKKVQTVTDFDWISQLRYYWRTEGKISSITCSMVSTEIKYGMEYLGNLTRLVITPLTDRCFRTLMGALRLCLGGAPEGPAGTGKTESVKDLAKAVAKKCVVFNCSEGLDYKALGKFFKGLAQSGAWSCFDEFNRIELEVLSVVAQQILTIQRAIVRKVAKFYFEESWLKLDPTCAIFITMNPGYAGRTELPDNLKVLFRTVAMMVPDYAMIGEITLYSNGFDDARPLAQKIVHTYKLCSEQLSSQPHYDYGMRAVKSVLLASSSLRQLHPLLPEAQVVLRAIIDVNLPKFLEQDLELFTGIYQDLFPGVEVPEPAREDILKRILEILEHRNLMNKPWFVEKILQIYEMLLVRHGLMIVGGAMGGKTSAYQVLAEALRLINKDPQSPFKEYGVTYRVINPKAINMGQLYGSFDPISHEWYDGVLAKTFREYTQCYEEERFWIIFDGPIDALWIENLNTVLDDNKKLCLNSGEIIQMTKFMNMMFEPADLEQASPATVSRCGMIYMEPEMLGWEAFHHCFLIELEHSGITEIYLTLYDQLAHWLVPAAVGILKECAKILVTSPNYQYKVFSRFFKHFVKETKNINQTLFQQIFLFCYAWAYCPALSAQGAKTFDALLRRILYGMNEAHPKPKYYTLNRGQIFPDKYSLISYRFDMHENWWPWLKNEEPVFQEGKQLSEIIVPTKETNCLLFWLDICMKLDIPLLTIGPTGTGKTATILDKIISLPKQSYMTNIINFSARTSAQQVQEMVMSKLDRRRKGAYGPPPGKKCVIFCDDLGMPSKDTYGSQPPLELIRTLLDHGYWSHLKDTTKIELIDLQLICAMGLVGGSNYIFPRLYRHMFVLAIDSFEDATIIKIFTTIGDWYFQKDFPEKVVLLTKGLAEALVIVYREATTKFLPTPAKSHYTFSLRDVTRAYQGIVLVPAKRLKTPEKLGRLWIHETCRVFYDRLVEDKDRETFLEIIRKACKSGLRFSLESAFGNRIPSNSTVTEDDLKNLFFGNYMEPEADPKYYDEVESNKKLGKVMSFYLQDYNSLSKTPMDLVLFRYAIEHISRVCRVLIMPRGNILMVGVGGSSRSACVKLAASIADISLMTIQITKTYSVNEWRDDLRKILLSTGTGMKHCIFYFTDTQAIDEAFVEDVNSILNTGDLPNLYSTEEKSSILEGIMNVAKELGRQLDPSPQEMYAFYVERIRELLHMALAFSPIGDSFKERLRTFPSLVSCCTIDWYTNWPQEALVRVAEHFIISMHLSTPISDAVTGSEDQAQPQELTQLDEDEEKIALSDMEKELVEVVILFNELIVKESERCFIELNRRNYVTPTSYLELLRSFRSFYFKKRVEISKLRDRYTIGLEKLDNAAGQVGEMQNNLMQLQPQLKVLSEETEKILGYIERETAEAEKKKEIVGADEAAANEAAAAAQAIKDDCESDLQEAIPALEAALDALDTLKPADITVVKSMKSPPWGVKLVLEAVCVLRGVKPDRKPDQTGRMVDDYWAPSLRMLGDMKFLEQLKNFDKDNIPYSIMKKVREKYITDRDFDPDKIKNVSAACEGLCRWVRAMDVYDKVARIVAPKKLALAEAEAELTQQMEKLNAKRAELQEILDKLQKLNDFFAEKSREKKRLEDEIDNCEKKLSRAEKLLGGLGGEKTRWSESAVNLQKILDNIVGDVLLSAGCIAYLGFFTPEYRTKILTEWNEMCLQREIPCSEKFSLASTLGNPLTIRAWALAGLPSDSFSIDNAIIATSANRFPLMIDPQGQANKWVKNLEKENDLKVVKQTDENYMKVLEQAIMYGNPVLLENVGEKLDANLSFILEKNVIKYKGDYVIKIGDTLVEYNSNFRFYITTCLRNPRYTPEVLVQVTLLNFMITEQGLSEQLLATVVAYERPDLQEKKSQLIVESARNRDLLYNIESKILTVLSSAEGNVLEDENAINILSSSKILSEEIQAKQVIAVATEQEIDKARQEYLPVAKHSAILFFCITELSNIDPMYQYSLTWFLNLFVNTLLKAEKSEELTQRLEYLNDHFTKSIYTNVCRSLFEKDKLVISFVMCIGILQSRSELNKSHLLFLLTGGVSLENPYKNPAQSWLSEKAWGEIVRASDLEGLENFHTNFAANVKEWKKFYDLPNPHEAAFPSPYHDPDQTIALIFLRCVRPDKVVPAVRNYISRNMSDFFTESPAFNLDASFNDSSTSTPLVFLLSAGSDPMANLFAYAKQKGMYEKCKTISLGQGQGPKAEKMIYDGARFGHWVVLQNCHLATSWMTDLERICLDQNLTDTAHSDFRLWFTSYPSPIFPVSVLQNSVKMTNEAPKGLKTNMLKSFNSDPLMRDKFFSNAFVGKPEKYWLRGVFALVFFHAVVQERREYGPLGWNIPYEFTEADLKISLLQLRMFILQTDSIPFQGHTYLIGECNYGGRVTDDKDRRLILSLLTMIYNENTINVDNFSLSTSGNYKIPLQPNRVNSVNYVTSFPISPHPEVFGLHENADINRNNKETTSLLQGVLLTQTELVASMKSAAKESQDIDPAFNICGEILERLPRKFDLEAVSQNYPILYMNSMNTVLTQELIRFNRLLGYIQKSLSDVRKAVQGQIAMISELERTHQSMIIGKLPEDWLKRSYPSLKSLGNYVNDFIARLEFLQDWIDNGEPKVFWISGFYFTQSFITGVLQNYARKHRHPIDLVELKYTFTHFETHVKEAPEIGVYIRGLFLEAGRWDRKKHTLEESYPKILFDQLPILLASPQLKKENEEAEANAYPCPIYKTSARRGVLSTTGHSTNFVMFMDIPTKKNAQHWINRGTASLCQLDD